jgi:protein-S-isoprenylcysteine O-methyltransferase Ste14
MIGEKPYRLSRNPLYVGLLALYLGLALLPLVERRGPYSDGLF